MANNSKKSTPLIEISSSKDLPFRRQFASPSFHASSLERSRATPMSIPNGKGDSPPPPLPPPRYIDELTTKQDPGWHFAKRETVAQSNSLPIRSGSSLLSGSGRLGKTYSGPQRNIDFSSESPRNQSSGMKSEIAELQRQQQQQQQQQQQPGSPLRQETRVPDLQALLEYNQLHGEQHMGQRSLANSSHAYDKQVLSRIGGPRTPPRSAGGNSHGGQNEDSSPQSSSTTNAQNTFKKLNGQLRPLSMPERRHSDFTSQMHWSGVAPPSSAGSPGFSTLRSPISEHGSERVHPRQAQNPTSDDINSSASMSGRGARGDAGDKPEHEFPPIDGPGMHDLNSQERSPSASEGYTSARTGQKRRAQSPPGDAIDPRLPSDAQSSNNNDSWGKRSMQMASSRETLASRLQASQAGQASLSSSASTNPGNQSYASSYGLSAASPATSYSSDRMQASPYQMQQSSTSPRSNLPPQPIGSMMQQNAPQMQPPMQAHRRNVSGVLRAPGLWICDCCPKKPKKFDNEDDLRIHEMEKQYICQYCHNRFKNKNEAERHQNSLHLRRHSWSCAALSSFEAAFHPTPPENNPPPIHNPANNQSYPNASNNQNYSGDYNQSGGQQGQNAGSFEPQSPAKTDSCGYCGAKFPNPPDWEARVEHLEHIHKFGECNHSKKFYRADHFRQHLKHSHAGTSGKWTNMLENACMKEEPPPQPIAPGQQPPGPLPIGMVGLQYSHHQQQYPPQPGQHPYPPQSPYSGPQGQQQQYAPSTPGQQSYPGTPQQQHNQLQSPQQAPIASMGPQPTPTAVQAQDAQQGNGPGPSPGFFARQPSSPQQEQQQQAVKEQAQNGGYHQDEPEPMQGQEPSPEQHQQSSPTKEQQPQQQAETTEQDQPVSAETQTSSS